MDTSATLGVVTTDRGLVIRGWNEWLSEATGVAESGVVGRPLTDFVASGRAEFYRDLLTAVIESGEPRVLAPAFHRYLIECAPRQPSAHFDHMQQRVTVAPLKNEAEVVGVMITVEDVTARIDGERAISTQLKQQGAPPSSAVTNSLASDDWELRRQAVQHLKKTATVDEVKHLLETLQRDHHDLNILNSALRVLIASGRAVVEPLTSLLKSDEANLRMHAALALGELRAADAVPALIDALDDADENVRFHAIEALGRIGAADAVDALARVAASGHFFLAFAAVDALSKTEDSRVAPLVQTLLADELLRPAAIATLASIGDEDSVTALCEILDLSDDAHPIAAALRKIHQRYEEQLQAGHVIETLAREAVSDEGLRRLSDAAAASDDRVAAATVLGWLGPRALDTLVSLIGVPDINAAIVPAIEEAGKDAVDLIIPLLAREQPTVRAAAAALLGRLGDRRAMQPLVSSLNDVDESVVAAAAAGIATFGDAGTLRDLFGLLSHPSATVRRAAVAAINSMGTAATLPLVTEVLRDPSPIVRESAVRIAGYFGFPECVSSIRSALSDPAEEVRRAAIEQLPILDDAGAVTALTAALAEETPRNRAAAAHALRLVDDRQVAAALINALRDADPWVRYFAATSLGEQQAAVATASLADLARRDRATHVRIAAVTALSAVDGPTAADVIADLIASDDDDLAGAAVTALGAINRRESSELLAQAARSSRPVIQTAAIRALGRRPSLEAIELLSWAVRLDDQQTIGRDAVAGLCAIAVAPERPVVRRAAVDALLELAADGAHRDLVMAAIGALTEDLVPDVASGLSAARVANRLAAVDALTAMRNPRASRELARALRDEDAAVRGAAVTAFGKLGTPSVARTIAAMRRTDADATVRHRAAQACDRHGWNAGMVERA